MAEPAEPRSEPPVVLITGAAGAIGTALLRRFAATGARTVGSDLADAMTPSTPPPADLWVAGDVTVAEDMQRVVDATLGRFARLDVVVVGAGITALGSFSDTSDAVFRRVVDVNLHGAVHVTRAALPALRATRGRIVVLSSVAGFAPVAGRPAYTASKHALTGLFESLRPELTADGVSVTLVHPSFLATSPADHNAPDGTTATRTLTGPLLDADAVADDIVRAVARGRARIFPGRTAKAARLLHRVAPDRYAHLMQRRLAR